MTALVQLRREAAPAPLPPATARAKDTLNSVLAWSGPSQFTGREVEVLVQCLNTPSENAKTGPMVQVSIVQAGENPSLLRGTARENDICGDCRGQKGKDAWCYEDWLPFLIGQRRHLAERVSLTDAANLLRGRAVRVGAYGDPAAVPLEVWAELLEGVKGHTGYTHAWKTCDPLYSTFLMASVESLEEAVEATRRGWRTFRIRKAGGEVTVGEIVCPFESDGVQCHDCGLCAGELRQAKSIVITVHGPRARRFEEPTA